MYQDLFYHTWLHLGGWTWWEYGGMMWCYYWEHVDLHDACVILGAERQTFFRTHRSHTWKLGQMFSFDGATTRNCYWVVRMVCFTTLVNIQKANWKITILFLIAKSSINLRSIFQFAILTSPGWVNPKKTIINHHWSSLITINYHYVAVITRLGTCFYPSEIAVNHRGFPNGSSHESWRSVYEWILQLKRLKDRETTGRFEVTKHREGMMDSTEMIHYVPIFELACEGMIQKLRNFFWRLLGTTQETSTFWWWDLWFPVSNSPPTNLWFWSMTQNVSACLAVCPQHRWNTIASGKPLLFWSGKFVVVSILLHNFGWIILNYNIL